MTKFMIKSRTDAWKTEDKVLNRVCSRDVTADILMFQNSETSALVYRTILSDRILFSCKNVLLFQYIRITAGHVSENTLFSFYIEKRGG